MNGKKQRFIKIRRLIWGVFIYIEKRLSKKTLKYIKDSKIGKPLVFLYRNIKRPESIYPIKMNEIVIESDLDFLILEPPPRYIPMMPNGLGYVHSILKRCDIKFQIVDMNIYTYHEFHSERLLGRKPIITNTGYTMVEDPWDNTSTGEWDKPEVVDYYLDKINPIIMQVLDKKPKALGISVQANSRILVNKLIALMRKISPETVIVVGGYDCKYHDIGPYLVPDFDYMTIGDTELTMKALVTALANNERPGNLPGILSRYDSPNRVWMPTPEIVELDKTEFPKYEWIDCSLYRTFDGQQLIPITSTRGCSWSKCTFCAECFTFRKRSAKDVADEIEYWNSRKSFDHVFRFNDSDLNGDQQYLHDICTEILNRNLKANIIAQLRVSKRNTAEYFKHLKRAGFNHLRFGVDAWSRNTLKLQKKSNNMKHVVQNLKDWQDAGIKTCVNVVLGVPGETESDIDETIENLVSCRDYIDLVEGINTVILAGGSEYFNNPDKHNIHFRGDKESIYKEHKYVIPTDLWYSDEPYIDQKVRLNRMNRVCETLHKQEVNIGPYAKRIISNLKIDDADAAWL